MTPVRLLKNFSDLYAYSFYLNFKFWHISVQFAKTFQDMAKLLLVFPLMHLVLRQLNSSVFALVHLQNILALLHIYARNILNRLNSNLTNNQNIFHLRNI